MSENKPHELNELNRGEFNVLSERIMAQTEAYVGFSNALVSIIQKLADISSEIKDFSGDTDGDLQELNAKITEINKHLLWYVEARKTFDETMAAEMAAYRSTVKDMVSDIKGYHSTSELSINALVVKLDDHHRAMSVKHQETLTTLQGRIDEVSQKLEEAVQFLKTDQDAKLNNITGFVTMSNAKDKKLHKVKNQLWMLFAAIGTVVAFLMTLQQLGVFKIIWFGS